MKFNTFGERLTYLIDLNDTSREVLCNYLDVNKSTLSRYCNDVRFPPENTLLKIADFFNCTIDFLYGKVDDPKNKVVYTDKHEIEIKGQKHEIDIDALQELIKKLENLGVDTEILIKKDTDR